MKKLTFIFLFFISFSSFAFDYHGIKSGMHWDEVKALVKCGGEYSTDCRPGYYEHSDFFGGSKNSPPGLESISFRYTTDEKLWGITLVFGKYLGASGAAQLKALTELYKNSLSIEGDYFAVLLIDNDLFEEEVEKIYNETIDKY